MGHATWSWSRNAFLDPEWAPEQSKVALIQGCVARAGARTVCTELELEPMGWFVRFSPKWFTLFPTFFFCHEEKTLGRLLKGLAAGRGLISEVKPISAWHFSRLTFEERKFEQYFECLHVFLVKTSLNVYVVIRPSQYQCLTSDHVTSNVFKIRAEQWRLIYTSVMRFNQLNTM